MKTNYARFLKRTTAFVPATLLATVVSYANPLDGQVVAGSATITTPNPTTELINQQTNSAIINWKSFDIGIGETTQFIVPDYTGVTLNRVVGSQDPSKILGTLKSNGTVMVVNPDGILFGPNSRVDVGGLLATTSDIEDKDFMAKNYQFTKSGKSTASIVNQGMITVKDEGIAALVAPGVRNEGVITAKLGKVTLGAANKFTLDFYGDDLISLMLNDTLEGDVISTATGKPLSDKVANAGTIKADGGIVVLKAATARKVVNSVINNTGVIEANSVGVKNGKIMLFAATAGTKVAGAPVQTVKVSGTLSASGKNKGEKGGKVYVTGEAVEVASAKIDASGDKGGGAVLIGGDYLSHKATDAEIAALGVTWEAFVMSNATFVSLDDMTSINVNATTEGNGGKAVVWSDGATLSAAKITAKGGAVNGNGGFVETSGKYLDVRKAADASATNGVAGTWLLDPLDVHIKNVPEVTVNTAFNVDIYNGIFGNSTFPTGPASVINVANVQAALNSGTNVRVTTRGTSGSGAGDIYIDNGITKSAGGNISVVIDSAHDVIFGSGVNLISTSGSVDLGVFAKNGKITGNNLGQVKLNGGSLLLESTYGMTFRTNSDMPSNLYLRVNENGLSSGQTANIDVKFDQDTIKFTHTSTTATLPTGGIQLVDPTSSSFMGINFNALDVAFMDKSFVSKGHGWAFGVSKTFGAATGNALNGIAEIIDDSSVTITPSSLGAPGIVPVLEIDSTDANNCPGNLTCVASGPEGKARIKNYLHPVPVVTPVPAITINPIIATLVPLDTSLLGATQTSTPLVSLPNAQLTSSTAADVFDYAQLANDVYSDNANASGFKLATLVMKNVPGFMPVILLDNGLYANVYQRTKIINGVETVELVVGFRGSEPPAPNPLDLVDWASNFNQLIDSGLTTGQYVAAAKIVSDVTFAAIKLRQQGKNVTVTVVGHSLGGGLAQFASAMADGQVNKVITFNSAGLGAESLKQIGSSNLTALQKTSVTHIVTSGDPVHLVGTQLPGNVYSVNIPRPPASIELYKIPAYYHSMPNLLRAINHTSPPSLTSAL